MNFEVNITSYMYPDYVNSLALQIREALPKAFIRVWDNSPTQMKLPFKGVDEVRWNRFNPSLSRVWNWAIAQSKTDWVMVTNDDIRLKKNWLKDLNNSFKNNPNTLWHGPSRCFLFHKDLIQKVGWFDEILTGFCWEDLDYVRRLNYHKIDHRYGTRSSLNVNAESLKEKIKRDHNPANNPKYMVKKYGSDNQQDFNVAPLFKTEDFYPCRQK